MRTLLLAIVLVLFPGCAFLRKFLPEQVPEGVAADSVAIRGVHGRAAGIALADHLAVEQSNADRIRAEPPEQQDEGWSASLREAECWARPEAYDLFVSFSSEAGVYKVVVWPLAEVCLGKHADALRGGGAEYEIDARTFAVTKKELME